jgi:uncharacterized protein (TIGR02246 family)
MSNFESRSVFYVSKKIFLIYTWLQFKKSEVMSMFRKTVFTSTLAAAFLFGSCYAAGENRGEEAAVRKQAEAYAKAFNARNAKGLAALWAKDATYMDPETNETLKGREEIEKHFLETFKEIGNATMDISITTVSFPAANKAEETGMVTVKTQKGEKEQSAYKAFYEKRDGAWLLTQVREVQLDSAPTQYDHLKELEWLIGEWVDQGEDSTVETKIDWDKYKNFLTQHFKVIVEGQFELEGKQIIGWDPIKQKIRSWVFDSDGGFGEGTWTKEEGTWVVELAQTLADGRRASAVNVYKPIDKNSYSWESTGREVGGVLLPNIEPITVERKKG